MHKIIIGTSTILTAMAAVSAPAFTGRAWATPSREAQCSAAGSGVSYSAQFTVAGFHHLPERFILDVTSAGRREEIPLERQGALFLGVDARGRTVTVDIAPLWRDGGRSESEYRFSVSVDGAPSARGTCTYED
jgi:hypothetical protein